MKQQTIKLNIHLLTMNTLYITAIIVFIAVTSIIAIFTVKKFKNETGEKVWKLSGGRSAFWRILVLASALITAVIMLVLKWAVFS